MGAIAEKTDPELWDKVKAEITASDKGGNPGEWSARKAQMAVHEYRHRGGGYKGKKASDNHLAQWTAEDWGTGSGRPSLQSGERYLPKDARQALAPQDYARTTRKKRADIRKGHQHSAQPRDVAEKTAVFRDRNDPGSPSSKVELYAEARRRGIPGRSRMNKAGLRRALREAD